MILYSVFSDHALFCASSVLTLRGKAEPGAELTAEIRLGDDTVISAVSVRAEPDGGFSLPLETPEASFVPYTITLKEENGEQRVLHDILFGELYMASGQSNMELVNRFQPECPQMLASLKGKAIRVFAQDYGNGGSFSMRPEYTTGGRWLTAEDDLSEVSACATAFCSVLYDRLSACGKPVPVGFLNVSWGGTPIYGWIPYEILHADPVIADFLEGHDLILKEETFDTHGDLNFQQVSVMYNRKIAPVEGVRVRSVLWYQGENDCGHEFYTKTYARMLRLYHQYYEKTFAADPERFRMLSSLLFPWVYGNAESLMGYVNEAFVRTAAEEPDHFMFCPVGDLPPVWGAKLSNHPIHPTHKYRLGARMAKLMLANLYGDGTQKSAAVLHSFERIGSRLILHFDSVGSGLYLPDGHIRCMYIAGADGKYLPAECEILSRDTMAVWHPYLAEPVHCAYGFSSFEPGMNLFAGDYPCAPFATDDSRTRMISIEAKPFLNFDIDAQWEAHLENDLLNVYYHPVWKPVSGSEVCFDHAFVESTEGMNRSVRICGEKNPIGAYVTAASYQALDFASYTSMELDLYHRGTVKGHLELCFADGMEITRPMSFIKEAPCFFAHYSVDLTHLPEKTITSVRFVFTVEDGPNQPYINIGRIFLRP